VSYERQESVTYHIAFMYSLAPESRFRSLSSSWQTHPPFSPSPYPEPEPQIFCSAQKGRGTSADLSAPAFVFSSFLLCPCGHRWSNPIAECDDPVNGGVSFLWDSTFELPERLLLLSAQNHRLLFRFFSQSYNYASKSSTSSILRIIHLKNGCSST
jgi:hypothetical protein